MKRRGRKRRGREGLRIKKKKGDDGGMKPEEKSDKV